MSPASGTGGANPSASVCVATHERADRLPRLFQALSEQTVAPETFEVVVVDDGSRDGTVAVLHHLAEQARFRVRVVRLERNGGAARARNAAWRAASGERVLFTDDDCLPGPGWIAAHLEAARDWDVVVGWTGPAEGEVPDGPFARAMRVEDARFFPTCNVAYRREHLAHVGGFDERFRHAAGEDTDLGLRVLALGVVAGFSADARVVHPIRPSSLRAALRQSGRWADVVLVVRKHPEVRSTLLHHRVFWKAAHRSTVVLLAGCLVAAARPGGAASALGAACAVPWVRGRIREVPLGALPGTLLLDVVEVATMVRGSLRHGALVL